MLKASFFKTVFAVFFLHVVFLLSLFALQNRTVASKNLRKMEINTIILKKEEKPARVVVSKTTEVKKAETKKIVKKADQGKTNTTMAKAPESGAVFKKEAISQDLLRKLEKSVFDMDELFKEEKKPDIKTDLSVPLLSLAKPKAKPKSVGGNIAGEKIFHEKLIGYFKDRLLLPEYGEVKARIKIDKSGVIKEVEVLFSQNPKNALQLKNMLLTLTVPWIKQYIQEDEMDLIIHFTNEI